MVIGGKQLTEPRSIKRHLLINIMKKIFVAIVLISLFGFALQISSVYAVYVNGYYRSNGTYVNGYERTAPDGNPYNNYSYPGNYNPNTGEITGGNPDTYLKNYYNNSSGNSYSPPSYSYPTTPTCPMNSYYDGISSCKCNYGYLVSGESCVSANSVCYDQLGYSSSYDSLSNTCKCNYGYVVGVSGQCISGSSFCSSKLGLMSEYNSLSKMCECMTGYEFDGSSCVYKQNNYSYPSGYPSGSNNCPTNSHISPSDSTKCQCDVGFQPNLTNNGCVIIPIKTNNQICQDGFGLNSDWDGTKTNDGQLNCVCQNGYIWNLNRTACNKIEVKPAPQSSPPPIKSLKTETDFLPNATLSKEPLAPVKKQEQKKVNINETKTTFQATTTQLISTSTQPENLNLPLEVKESKHESVLSQPTPEKSSVLSSVKKFFLRFKFW